MAVGAGAFPAPGEGYHATLAALRDRGRPGRAHPATAIAGRGRRARVPRPAASPRALCRRPVARSTDVLDQGVALDGKYDQPVIRAGSAKGTRMITPLLH